MSPEVSLFECLYSLGETTLGQARAEFKGDTTKAARCITAMFESGFVTVVKRHESGESITPAHELRVILANEDSWRHFDEETAPVILQITDAGERAFESETGFIEKLDEEYRQSFRRQTWRKKSKKQ